MNNTPGARWYGSLLWSYCTASASQMIRQTRRRKGKPSIALRQCRGCEDFSSSKGCHGGRTTKRILPPAFHHQACLEGQQLDLLDTRQAYSQQCRQAVGVPEAAMVSAMPRKELYLRGTHGSLFLSGHAASLENLQCQRRSATISKSGPKNMVFSTKLASIPKRKDNSGVRGRATAQDPPFLCI